MRVFFIVVQIPDARLLWRTPQKSFEFSRRPRWGVGTRRKSASAEGREAKSVCSAFSRVYSALWHVVLTWRCSMLYFWSVRVGREVFMLGKIANYSLPPQHRLKPLSARSSTVCVWFAHVSTRLTKISPRDQTTELPLNCLECRTVSFEDGEDQLVLLMEPSKNSPLAPTHTPKLVGSGEGGRSTKTLDESTQNRYFW